VRPFSKLVTKAEALPGAIGLSLVLNISPAFAANAWAL